MVEPKKEEIKREETKREETKLMSQMVADKFEEEFKIAMSAGHQRKLEGFVECFEKNKEIISTAFSSMKTVYEYCKAKGVFSSNTNAAFEQSIADFKGSIKMSKDLFICVNTNFVEGCITYYSNPAVTSNMAAIQAISQSNQTKTQQIYEAFDKVHKDLLKTSNDFEQIIGAMFDDFRVYQEKIKAELEQLKTKVDAASGEIDAVAQRITTLQASSVGLAASSAIPYVGVLATIANLVLIGFIVKATSELATAKSNLKAAENERNSKQAALDKDIPYLQKAIGSLNLSLKVVASLCHLVACIYQIQKDFAKTISARIGEIVNTDVSVGEDVAKLLATAQFPAVVDDLKQFRDSNKRCINLYQEVLSLVYVDITAKPSVKSLYLDYAKMTISPE